MQVERQVVELRNRRLVIDLPESFVNHRVEVIALTLDDELPAAMARRRPHPEIAGKGQTIGDLIAPVVDDREAL